MFFWVFYLGFVGISVLGIDTLIVLDVLESLIHQTSVASLISILSTAIDQILFAQRHQFASFAEVLTLQSASLYKKSIVNQLNSWIKKITSITAEKDQQEPHCPWSLTSVTAPWVLQSTETGGAALAGSMKKEPSPDLVKFLPLKPFMMETNSWWSWIKN